MSNVQSDTHQDVTAILNRFYAAETAYLESDPKDFGIIAAVLHPECVMRQPNSLPYGGIWEGHGGFEQWLIEFGAVWQSLTVTDPRFFPSGDDVILVRSTVHATARANGNAVTWPLLQMITVKDGLIREIQPFHWDTAAICEALNKAHPLHE
jgi:uncharacterized protein